MELSTPIYDYLTALNYKNPVRFFMPGHKGKSHSNGPLTPVLSCDITEIAGADALFAADGIIGESERNAACLYGTRDTLYSTQGSTLCIQAMVYLASLLGNQIIAGRNAHNSFLHACALLGMEPVWVLPEAADAYGICGLVTAGQVEQSLQQNPDACAVYLTSPDYLGNTSDIRAIAVVCRQYGVPLFCDNAHGAYFRFVPGRYHPISLGATMCCDSAHKTLPVLTGGAYLHLSESCSFSKQDAKYAMSVFGSTSPSYLTLLSLDLCNQSLGRNGEQEFDDLKRKIDALKHRLKQHGIPVLENALDFAKVTIDAAQMGYSGKALEGVLSENNIVCEYCNEQYLVLMLSPFHTEEERKLLSDTLCSIVPEQPLSGICAYQLPEQVLLPGEVLRMEAVDLPVCHAEGRIAARTVSACPPGVPVVVQGERINSQAIKILKNSGISFIKVLK